MRVSVVATGIERATAPAEIVTTTARASTSGGQRAAQAGTSATVPAGRAPAPVSDGRSGRPVPPEPPIGEVHDRIRRMLTEDAPVPLKPEQALPEQKPNPFRKSAATTIDQAIGRLKETFVKGVGPSEAEGIRPTPVTRDAFADHEAEDLDIPAFLRTQAQK